MCVCVCARAGYYLICRVTNKTATKDVTILKVSHLDTTLRDSMALLPDR